MNIYLLMYRSTPHSTTGVSPAELLFKRKLSTKLPEFEVSYFDDDLQSVRDRDSEIKQMGKRYADLQRDASYNDSKPGDTVLMKQCATDKLSTTFRKEPFIVVAKQRNSVAVDDGVGQYKRNVTHFKKFNTRANYGEALGDNDKGGELPQLNLFDATLSFRELNQ